ncbi:hypothetical protein L6452_09142 [Arctium lappa]|uniref:Uncharacterized protein n=1 Tax=Arctium lappa TaxID=4217 RepID=A0ACB9DK16_ARCLA|nr:hypothetical protein L6452_09142 [Arctium lappa]
MFVYIPAPSHTLCSRYWICLIWLRLTLNLFFHDEQIHHPETRKRAFRWLGMRGETDSERTSNALVLIERGVCFLFHPSTVQRSSRLHFGGEHRL